jgi:hypothetical protein
MTEPNQGQRSSTRPDQRPSPSRRSPDHEEVCRLLRDSGTSAETIRAIADDPTLQAFYPIRLATVLRPEAPLAMALRLLPALLWRDIARVMEDVRLYAPLRARAEKILAERLPEMTAGEKMSLARIASCLLIRSLRESYDARVIGALLGNPRTIEEDVMIIARSESSPASVLSVVARSDRWRDHYQIKLALAQNPKCPPMDSLRSLRGLMPRDLRRITDNPSAPRLVRMGASRRLSEHECRR